MRIGAPPLYLQFLILSISFLLFGSLAHWCIIGGAKAHILAEKMNLDEENEVHQQALSFLQENPKLARYVDAYLGLNPSFSTTPTRIEEKAICFAYTTELKTRRSLRFYRTVKSVVHPASPIPSVGAENLLTLNPSSDYPQDVVPAREHA